MTTVQISIPSTVNLSMFTDVQRGTVFMTQLTIIVVFIGVIVKIVSNKLDADDGQAYEDKGEEKKPSAESEMTFDKIIIKQSVIEEEDPGSTVFVKKLTEFNSNYMPIFILFHLNLITGTTYAFDMSLYFFTVLPMLLFNLMKLHRKCIDHKVFIMILQNLWLVLAFFWMVNIWATGRWIQPYYKM